MPSTEVKVPDIGDFKNVEVIEILVKPGDTVAKEQSLVTLESDKATMEIPSPGAGVVKEVRIKVGDKVSQGTLILELDAKDEPKKAESKKQEPAPQATPAPSINIEPTKGGAERPGNTSTTSPTSAMTSPRTWIMFKRSPL